MGEARKDTERWTTSSRPTYGIRGPSNGYSAIYGQLGVHKGKTVRTETEGAEKPKKQTKPRKRKKTVSRPNRKDE